MNKFTNESELALPYLEREFGHSHYELQGVGPPLLLFNGLGFSRWSWSWQWDQLSQLQLVLLENRGMGGSDLGEHPFELSDLADDAARLLDHLQLDKACVWGVSMGGMIAQEFAVRHPQRCAGLILGCTLCGGSEAVYMSNEVMGLMARLAQQGFNADSVRAALDLNFSPEVEAEVSQPYIELRSSNSPPYDTWLWQRQASLRFDASQTLSSYAGPALLLHGGQDRVVPFANLEVLQRKLPQAEVRVWPQAAHLFWIEHAAEVNALVTDFVMRCC